MISLCMIVKNEEDYVRTCLESVYKYVDELIIVDTGSTDKTISICEEYGAKIFHYTWNDNFSDARNFSISCANGDWILVLDADEYLDEEDANNLANYVKYMEDNELDAAYCVRFDYLRSGGWSEADIIRLFRNKEEIRYRGAVYESVKMSKKKLYINREHPIKLHHVGFLKKKDFIHTKRKTYLHMTLQSLEDQEKDYRLYYWEAQNAMIYGDLEKAEEYCRDGIKINPESKRMYELLGRIHMFSGAYEQAKQMFNKVLSLAKEENSKVGKLHSKFYIRALNDLTELYYIQGEYEKALEQLNKNLTFEPSAYLYTNKGLIEQKMGRYEEALASFASALKMNPYLCRITYQEDDGFACLARTFHTFRGLQKQIEECKNGMDIKKAVVLK